MTLEEPEILQATRSPHGYLASPWSDNISVREDGSLIVVGCPVARTGWQKYSVGDLPQQLAQSLGIDTSNPHASIELYRPEEEVFHPEFLASLNGVPICDNHPPDGEFVNKDNYAKYAKGHIQNVRKGPDQLEDGEWPVIADLIISGEPLVSKVLNKQARENSLGYDFSIRRDGDKIVQCSMIGNHNAVVPNGRAGDYVSIQDADPTAQQSLATSTAPPEVAAAVYAPIVIPPIPTKETHPVAEKKSWLRLFKGKHLIELARATDADPEKIMEAVDALHEDEPKEAEDKKAKDNEVVVPPNTQENEFKSETGDAKHKSLHDALDRMLDKKASANDADIAELKKLMGDFLSEEEKEPEHEAVDTAPLDEVLAGKAEDCEGCGMAMDACVCDEEVEPGEHMTESGEEVIDSEEGGSPDDSEDDDLEDVEDRKRAKDRARVGDAAAGAMAVLRVMRPAMARTTDKAAQASFNAALASVKKSSRVSTGDYGKFAAAARVRDKAPAKPAGERARASDANDQIAKMQKFYDEARKGGK